MLINHHYKALQKTRLALIHGLVIEGLTFLIFSSLMICVSRDPGPVNVDNYDAIQAEDENIGVMEALNQEDEDVFKPGKWCRKCWVSASQLVNADLHLTLLRGPKARKSSPLLNLWALRT
jgi:palmitoyltransferase ZDHHC2/15/20